MGDLELPAGPLSHWLDSTERTSSPPLTDSVDVDGVGAGIAGISTATFLAERGHSVALVDADRVANRTTGTTTAKVTAGHGLQYDYLLNTFGERKAWLYADANRTALETVGVSRDADGGMRVVSGTCTYSGCVLSWNSAQETWDCPCDGSRYESDGTVIDGPAQRDLRTFERSFLGETPLVQ